MTREALSRPFIGIADATTDLIPGHAHLASLERAVARLTREQRTLFEMHHLHHRPIQELAQTLRKSEDAVKSHLYRARKLLLAR